MEGDKRKDDKKEENQQHGKTKCDDEVKVMLFSTKKNSKDKIRKEESREYEAGHNLNTINYNIYNYNFRNKYKPFHDREYGVYYHRDYAAYNYRGYEIKEPKVKICPVLEENKEQTMRWVQYMTHAEKQPRKPPRMYYYPNDNSFVQIVLMSLLLFLIITLSVCFLALYVTQAQTIFKDPYLFIWIPGVFGIVFTVYMVLCSACTRIFPIGLILLLINVFSMCWMCMYVTIYHETYCIILALMCIILTVVFLIVCALCDFDFRRFKFLIFTGILSFAFIYGLIWILIEVKEEEWLSFIPRREIMLIFGTVVYCLSLVLVLQLIIADRTVQLANDDYAIGTFMLYMCIPCLFMKLVAYLGLFDENR